MANFNFGFLRAVKGSIQESLASALKKTESLKSNAIAASAFDASVDMHKVLGALKMMNLDGCSVYCQDLEKLALAMQSQTAKADASTVFHDGVAALQRYIDDLLDGMKDLPIRLYTNYRKTKAALGEERASPVDLFYPNFDADLDASVTFAQQPQASIANAVKVERPKFQAALVKWMKEPGNAEAVKEAAAQMKSVCQSLSDIRAKKSYYLFWKSASAFMDVLVHESSIKQLNELRAVISKIDVEMRKFAEGTSKRPADDAFRGVLFHLAQIGDYTPEIAECRKLFGLDLYWNEVLKGMKESESSLHLVNVDEIKEFISQAKDELTKLAGNQGSAAKFLQLTAATAGKIAAFQNPSVKKLSDAVLFVAQKLSSKELRLTDMIAEEVAYIIVLLEGLVEKRGRVNSDFAKQVECEIKRLSAALKNQPELLATLQLPELDDQTKHENEMALIRHTVSEIKVDLDKVEETLDTFFRSAGENRNELAETLKPIKRVQGALRILGQKDAARIMEGIGYLTEQLSHGHKLNQEDTKRITEGVGGVSLFLDAFQDESADAQNMLAPLITLFFGEPAKTESEQAQAEEAAREEIETAVADAQTEESVAALEEPVCEAAAEAEPVQAPAVAAQEVVAEAPAAAAQAPVSQAIAAEAPGVWDSPSDDELAEVYLEETIEIFEQISQSLDICEAKPFDKEALTTIRRQYHTLKGSGRMVGLSAMGEAAWSVEHFLNKWLTEDRPASKELLGMIREVTGVFEKWVAELKASNKVWVAEDLVKEPVEEVANPGYKRKVYGAAVVSEVEPAVSEPIAAEETASPVEVAEEPAAAFEPAEELPAVEAAEELPAVEAAEEIPAVEAAEEPPAIEAAEELPAVEAAEELPAIEAAEELPAIEAAEELPAIEAAEELPAVEAAEELPAIEAAEELPAIEAAEELPAIEAAEELPAIEAAEELPAIEAAEELPAIEAAAEFAEEAVEEVEEVDAVEEFAAAEAAEAEPAVEAADAVETDEAADELPAIEAAEAADEAVEAAEEISVVETAEEPIEEAEIVSEDAAGVGQADAQEPIEESSAEEGDYQIGDVAVSKGLYDIFCAEVAERLATLESEVGYLASSGGGEVREPLVRSAHTLGSIGRTVGFVSFSNLGSALEDWCADLLTHKRGVDSAQTELLSETAQKAREMFNAILSKQEPETPDVLIARLEEQYKACIDGRSDAQEIDEEGLGEVFNSVAEHMGAIRAHIEKLEGLFRALGNSNGALSEALKKKIELITQEYGDPEAYLRQVAELLDEVSRMIEEKFGDGALPEVAASISFDDLLAGDTFESDGAQASQTAGLQMRSEEICSESAKAQLSENGEADENAALEAEAARLAQEEQDRLAQEEQDRLAQEEQDRLAQEEQDRLAQEAEEARLAKEAELARLAQEAELARLAQEAEEARLEKEAELARVAQEAEEARLAKEAEEARLAKEAEESRLAKEAEEARLAQEAEEARLAQEAEQAALAQETEGFDFANVQAAADEFDLGLDLGFEIDPSLSAAADGDNPLGLEIDGSLASGAEDEQDSGPEAPGGRLQELIAQMTEAVAGQMEDDLDESLLPVFAEEAQDLVPQINQLIGDLLNAPSDHALVNALHRSLHTLKGSARMVGALKIGNIVHHMETMMAEAEAGKIDAGAVAELLEAQFDKVGILVEYVLNPGSGPAPSIDLAPAMPTGNAAAPSADGAAKAAAAPLQERSNAQKAVRIGTDIIDQLVNEAGEVRLSGAALSGGLSTFRRALGDLGENAKRMQKMLRELEIQTESQMAARKAVAAEEGHDFDPLEFDRFTETQELSRFLAEGMHDIIDLQNNLDRLAHEQESVIIHQEQMSSDIQQTLMRVRLVQFDTIADRLYKVVRQTAKELGKKVVLEIVGDNVEIDRGVLDRMVAPLEHILRNGVAHGIELPENRRAAGKAEAGKIVLTVTHEGNFVQMRLVDDGQGLHTEKVKQKAIEKGLIKADEHIADDRCVDLIFLPGFSTADSVSQIAGRGVGMDVVKSEIVSLGGQVDVKSVFGHGMSFTISLPVSLATTQAVLVEAFGKVWAVPTDLIDEIRSLKLPELEQARSAKGISFQGLAYDFHYLPHLLGEHKARPETKQYNSVILARAGEKHVAVHVDKLMGTREIVVKNIGKQMSRISGITGATVLGDGRLGVIINPVYLANRKANVYGLHGSEEEGRGQSVRITRPVVMVVDDSLTIRKATSKLLTREGYEVMLAKDGMDALEKLQEQIPHVILSDVEMPRMDGFELLKNVRAEAKYKDIPVIMITSRTAEKHVNMGMSLGANMYLGKPYKDEELLDNVKNFVEMQMAS